MIMTIGQRLRRAMANARLTQKEVSVRTGLEQATVSDIVNDRANPRFTTVERMVEAIGTTFGELFDEPRIYLSERDTETLTRSTELNQRLLTNDAAQKALRNMGPPKTPKSDQRRGALIHDSRPHPADELVNLVNHKIPEAFVREGARQAFRVITDTMIGAAIHENDIIYIRWKVDVDGADDEIIVCRLNGALKLKRLDLRGGEKKLQNANPRYTDLVVTDADTFHMIGVVVTAGK
jgi:transcriptional regulator with XRE-family HTH domain